MEHGSEGSARPASSSAAIGRADRPPPARAQHARRRRWLGEASAGGKRFAPYREPDRVEPRVGTRRYGPRQTFQTMNRGWGWGGPTRNGPSLSGEIAEPQARQARPRARACASGIGAKRRWPKANPRSADALRPAFEGRKQQTAK